MRILPTICAAAAAFASSEVEQALPFVKSALDEVPADLKASKPLVALGHTIVAAGEKMFAAGTSTGFTGLLGAIGKAWLEAGLSDHTAPNIPATSQPGAE